MVNQPIPKTALVVDDSMLIRHSVCRFLEERGFVVESATNGVEALQVLSNFVPDIIITDLSMPRMNGVELVSRIRQLEVFADTPIIVLAARRSASELNTDMPSGTAAVIFKDIDIEAQLGRALDATLAFSTRRKLP
jgi:CheY-like chemotaxis protein